MKFSAAIYTFKLCLIIVFCMLCRCAMAQKAFVEGFIAYKVTLVTAKGQQIPGRYIFTIKGQQLKKELYLDNGFQDVIFMNFSNNTGYTLKMRGAQKYAIQINLDSVVAEWQQYSGYNLAAMGSSGKTIAGYAALQGTVTYKDTSKLNILYTADWYPAQFNTFERFPGANFLPLSFNYSDGKGNMMKFEAEKIDLSPVENSAFRKPADYKVIPYTEYSHQVR